MDNHKHTYEQLSALFDSSGRDIFVKETSKLIDAEKDKVLKQINETDVEIKHTPQQMSMKLIEGMSRVMENIRSVAKRSEGKAKHSASNVSSSS